VRGNRSSGFSACLFACGLAALAAPAWGQHAAEGKDMALVGYNDLQARTAYQPVIHRHGSRWIAYVGHHGGVQVNPLAGVKENNGTSILDVTNPKQPKYLAHVPGDEGEGEAGAAQMVRVCEGRTLPKGDPAKVYMLRSFGNQGHEIWDVTVPEKPALLTTVVKGLKGTHKNWWECDTGIAYLVSGVPDWRSDRMMQVYDLSDPAKPTLIRNFSVPGTEPGSTETAAKFRIHGAISTGPNGNRVYVGYGTAADGLVQILDRDKLLNGPKEPTPENLRYPVIAQAELPPYMGAHTTLPVLGIEVADLAKYWGPKPGPKHRDIIVIVNESTGNECRESRQMAYFMDISNEKTPMVISNFDVPEAPGKFCSRGGRFGAHSSNENLPPMYARRIVFMTWFNAGVRAVDIRDPYRPREIAHYIPATTDKTVQRCVERDGKKQCKIAIQTNNVEVDDRGYIYIVDRVNTGMHILELTGAARRVANLK
jgi:hypothetical protein